MTLREELENKQYWEETYIRLSSKQGIGKDNINEMWKYKEIYKDDIVDELMNGTYEWSIPRKVLLKKPGSKKRRTVYVYGIKDRYVIGIIYRAVSHYFSNQVSDNCFSYKRSVSTSHAIQYVKDKRKEQHTNGVKMDIHSYFNSVSREKVESMINELFDGGFKVSIEKLMLTDKVEWKDNIIDEWKSLIPGCALGSFFANWTLRDLDEYFNNQGIIYARYSDDIVIIEDTKEKLLEDIEIVSNKLTEYGLEMNPEKYTWFEPGDDIDFLGLKLQSDGTIDIADHAKMKVKRQIHRWCRKGRLEMEIDKKPFEQVAHKIIRRLNNKNFICAVTNDNSFGWASYSFPRITTTKTLEEIDLYTKDTLRAMKTGKHNKANYRKMSEEEFNELGWLSLVQMYNLYKMDKDYYMEVIDILK